jgi:hypothetical protein
MGHLSIEDVDKAIKGKTTKLAFLLKLKEWISCKECHAESYIRLYKYLNETSDLQITMDLTGVADGGVLVGAAMVAPVMLNPAPPNPLNAPGQLGAPLNVGVEFVPPAAMFVAQGDLNIAPIAVPAPQPIEVAVEGPDEEEDEVHDDDGADADVEHDDAPDLNPNE